MTALDRLIKADGVQGGTIHGYNRRFGRDVTAFQTFDEWKELADRLLDEGKLGEARLAIAVLLDVAAEGLK